MLALPHEMRDILVEQLDEFASNLTDTSDVEAIAQQLCAIIEKVAVQSGIEDADDILANLEDSGELDASLVEVLEEDLGKEEDLDFTGEDYVSLIEKLCEIEWIDDEDDDDDDDDEEERIRESFFDDDDDDY